MKRDKSNFEKWFSFSRHKRRAGAKELSSLIPTDFESQKRNIMPGDTVVNTYGSANSIEEHFEDLKNEFSGQSEICYTHAKIIVLIRREFEIEKHYKLFEQLWREEKDFLLENLNTRWLLSAADTFADLSKDDAIKGLSIACICLLNTVRISDSERFLTNADACKDSKEIQDRLDSEERFELLDGISVFKFGTDDALRNTRWRIDKMAKSNVAGEILLETFERLQKFDTVYKRTKDRHTRDKTGWW